MEEKGIHQVQLVERLVVGSMDLCFVFGLMGLVETAVTDTKHMCTKTTQQNHPAHSHPAKQKRWRRFEYTSKAGKGEKWP